MRALKAPALAATLRSGPSQLEMLRTCASICGLVGCAPGKEDISFAKDFISALSQDLRSPVNVKKFGKFVIAIDKISQRKKLCVRVFINRTSRRA